MYLLVVEQLSLKETGADKQDNQLTAKENHDCCSLHETLLQNELKMAVSSLLQNLVEKKKMKRVGEGQKTIECGGGGGKKIEMRRRRENNGNEEGGGGKTMKTCITCAPEELT